MMQCYKRVMYTLCKTTQTHNVVTVTVKTAKLQLRHCCKNEMTHGKMFLQELCTGLIPQMPLRKHPAQKAYQICSKQQLWFLFEAWILRFPMCLFIYFNFSFSSTQDSAQIFVREWTMCVSCDGLLNCPWWIPASHPQTSRGLQVGMKHFSAGNLKDQWRGNNRTK